MSNEQALLKNEQVRAHFFLDEMYKDDWFPDFLVDKGKQILIDLCFEIESIQPKDLQTLYQLTHQATNLFNDLEDEFEENDSELETVARECICLDFEFIAQAYGFKDADFEELTGTRNW